MADHGSNAIVEDLEFAANAADRLGAGFHAGFAEELFLPVQVMPN